jgi:trimethylamine--corrinoid protein Co-methyltransferase
MVGLHGQLNPWSPADLEKIHQAALVILEKTGVSVDNDVILDRLEATEAKVDRDRRIVRFPAAMVQETLRKAPGSWDRNLSGDGSFTVSVDCGAYFAWDYATRQSRPGTLQDLIDVPRLVEALPNIGEAGNLIYMSEIPAPVRDMIVYRHMWNHTQKKGGGGLGRCPSCCHALSVRSFDYLCEMLTVKIGPQKMQQEPEFSFFMGAASPLRWGHDILEMAMHAIDRGQVVGIGGNCICGIQSPITPASNIALDHAERLSGLCIVTAIKPDAKFYFINHTYLLDMQSGDIGSGSPEQTLQALLGKKVLEHCGFQVVVNHPILDTGSHIPDAQVAAEKAMYMLLTALGGAKGIGGAGQLKEIFCYEQLVIDHEIAGYIKHLLKGAAITDQTIGLPSILEGGIGGNFLDSDATLEFMRECYYSPQLFYRKRMSEWVREGSKDTLTRAHEKVEAILASETPTFLTVEQKRAMDDIIKKACAELAPGFDPVPYLG